MCPNARSCRRRGVRGGQSGLERAASVRSSVPAANRRPPGECTPRCDHQQPPRPPPEGVPWLLPPIRCVADFGSCRRNGDEAVRRAALVQGRACCFPADRGQRPRSRYSGRPPTPTRTRLIRGDTSALPSVCVSEEAHDRRSRSMFALPSPACRPGDAGKTAPLRREWGLQWARCVPHGGWPSGPLTWARRPAPSASPRRPRPAGGIPGRNGM